MKAPYTKKARDYFNGNTLNKKIVKTTMKRKKYESRITGTYVACEYCGHTQDADTQANDIARLKLDIRETHCKKCGMVITVVYTMFGIQCLETLIKNYNEKRNINKV